MTIQSYEIRALDDFGGRIYWMPSGTGAWCPADSVRRLEAGMKALRAEVARLTALLGPQKILRAEEVTEPGWYRWREDKESPWRSVEVDIDADGDVNVWVTGSDIPYYGNEWGVPYGEFYGPLKDPEV